MNEFSTRSEICCHTVELRYWDIDQELTDEIKESLIEQGEERAKEMINDGYRSGELNSLWNDEEIGGWWEISD